VGADLSDQPMTAVGDSVMLGATGALEKAFDVTVDAAVSRQFPQIIERIDARKAAGQMEDVVIIHAGTNGTAYWDMLKNTLDGLQDKQVVLVTVHTPNSWMDDSNRNIKGMLNQFDNVRIADWEAGLRRAPGVLRVRRHPSHHRGHQGLRADDPRGAQG
jgi:hypothetical protein